MSIIDWSDPEEMLGLLAEYLRDEIAQGGNDRERVAFLRALFRDVNAIASRADARPRETLSVLRDISHSQPEDFANDPALVHVNDCIQELERIVSTTRNP